MSEQKIDRLDIHLTLPDADSPRDPVTSIRQRRRGSQ
jgi:hypothetical protein